ncbi:Y-family DNA polymerase [Planctobacterium marinum]|uniref:Nucleotidyltransferase n=1 Tax=Planctobacterium marinum TaxID=1631968 RepID=A0AA48HMD6_9ALTE|nr:nucleotidyltransferase [Planctobacterium marinum]
MKKLWLYLHFPALQMDCQFATENDKAIIILDAKDNRIRQLNSQAQQAGLKPGMGLGSASALCHELQVEPYNPDYETNKIKHLCDSLYQLTSDIVPFSSNGVLLRIHTMLRFYQGLDNYWQAISRTLHNNQVRFHYATGSTPFAAKLLAESGWDTITDNHPNMRKQLLAQPIEASELDNKTIENLKRVGIRLIGDLAAISLNDIAKRFDIQLLTYMGRLLGELHHSVNFYHPEKRFNRRLELLYEIDNTQILLPPATLLLEALEDFLLIREQVTEEIILSLHQREQASLPVQVNSAEGEYRATTWQALLKLKLENVQLKSPVYALSLETGNVRLKTAQSNDLFSGKKSVLSQAQLISLLQARLGLEKVQTVSLQDDFRPEYINCYQAAGKPLPAIPQLQANRPFFLLAKPQRLTEKVQLVQGPERILSGWWDDHPVLRDYFIAHSVQGRWYWVFRTTKQQWFLHGIFS